MSRSEKLYKDSPKTERSEDGKVRVAKPSSKEGQANGTGGGEPINDGKENGVPAPARHMMERAEMHHKHEREHHTHDHGAHGEKAEMHKRHQKEMADMHKRHDKELKGEKSPSTEGHAEKKEHSEKSDRKEEGSAKEKKKD